MRKPKIVGKYDCTVHPRWFSPYPIAELGNALNVSNNYESILLQQILLLVWEVCACFGSFSPYFMTNFGRYLQLCLVS